MVTASPPAAQDGRGSASITVLRPLTVTVVNRLRFGQAASGGRRAPMSVTVESAPVPGSDPAVGRLRGTDRAPSVIVVHGDPGRAYRIALPSAVRTTLGRHPVSRMRVWSASLGDIGRTRIGQLDATGRDTLRIGGTLNAPFAIESGTYTANVPVQIAYE